MSDILDDLNGWLALLVVERRYRQQAGEEPGADMDLVTRAIDEIASLRSTLAAKDASFEINGDDMRREPFETRKATLASVLKRAAPGLRLNEHIEADGPTVFAHACKMGLEGIVSKRKTSPYRSGRSPDWIKSKNPACEAVRREAEEDWGR